MGANAEAHEARQWMDKSANNSSTEKAGKSGAPTSAAPDLQSPAAAAAALRTFFNIARAWDLSNDEQQRLLGCGRSTFFDWKAGRVKAGLDGATLERLSHLFGIYAGLQVLLPIPERANAWLKKPNSAPLFGGGSALTRLLSGQIADLFVVRQYLDAQRGGWA
jgi:hypothetical protein